MIEVRAVTLYQPWAQAVALGLKRHETRGWSTTHRGRLLIHAGRRWTGTERAFWGATAPRLLLDFDGVTLEQHREFGKTPPLGCVVAVADLVECRAAPEAPNLADIERHFGDFTPGRFAWRLEGVVRLKEPVPCRGMQGLWVPAGRVVDAVEAQL